MTSWTQVYDPLNNQLWSTLAAALPLIILAYLLGIKKLASHKAVLMAWFVAAIVACGVFKMPVMLAGLSSWLGLLNGLMIMYIIYAAILFYNFLVETKQFDVVKGSLASLSDDPRIQAVLVAFAFGTLLEAIAGGGTPVAITSAMLVGMGFEKIYAAKLCLLTNTAPVAFGGVGIAIIMLEKVTNIPLESLSAMAGRQTPLLSFFVPLMLVYIMSGWRGLKDIWPIILGVGVVFALTQGLVANFMGPMLPDVIGAVVTILFTIAAVNVWKPKTDWRFPGQAEIAAAVAKPRYSLGELVHAWHPFVILIIIVGLWGTPAIVKQLNQATINFPIAGLNNMIIRVPPIVASPSPYGAVFSFNWLASPGTAVLLTTIITAMLQKKGLAILFEQAGKTLYQLRYAIATGTEVLALAWIMNYGGLTSALAIAAALTGVFFPFFSPFLGWLGVFLTGSDTNSNALFGNLQVVTAQQLGISPILAAASNATGGSLGKMISPISLVVATSATGLLGKEGELFRGVFRYSIYLTTLMGILCMLQAYILPWMIP